MHRPEILSNFSIKRGQRSHKNAPEIPLEMNFHKHLPFERLQPSQETLFARVHSNFLLDVYLRVSVSDTFSNL